MQRLQRRHERRMTATAVRPEASPARPTSPSPAEFLLHLDNFEGPFDLLLSLIAKHKLDITEVALSQGHRRVHRAHQGRRAATGTSSRPRRSSSSPRRCSTSRRPGCCRRPRSRTRTTSRCSRRATCCSRGCCSTAPSSRSRRSSRTGWRPRRSGSRGRWGSRSATRRCCRRCSSGSGSTSSRRSPRRRWSPSRCSRCPSRTCTPRTVSVREQAALVVDRLRRQGTMTFRALCGDAPDTLTKVARFLSLLELFREGAVGFDQVTPLGELTVRWTGAEDGEVEITDEFDGAPPEVGREVDGGRAGASRRTRQDGDRRMSRDGRVTEETDARRAPGRPAAGARGAAHGRRPAAGPPDAGLRRSATRPRRCARRSPASRRSTPSRAAGSTCATSPVAGASTPARSSPRSWRSSSLDGQQARLTQAALETLAVVAYRQPVSRARVSAIRGVNVDGVMRTLVSRGLVEEAGQDAETHRDPLPHHRLLPRADRHHLARRPARARAVPARPRRPRRPRPPGDAGGRGGGSA